MYLFKYEIFTKDVSDKLCLVLFCSNYDLILLTSKDCKGLQ